MRQTYSGVSWSAVSPSGSLITYLENYLPLEDADRLLELSKILSWQQNTIQVRGQEIRLPRKEIMFGDLGTGYQYLGVALKSDPWTEWLQELREKVEAVTGYRYQMVIGNLYRSGADHIGYHADDSPEIGSDPAIASVSLGASRRFQVRNNATGETQSFDLGHGDLLVMHPGCQTTHKHRLVKTQKQVGIRINWTFRPYMLASSVNTPSNLVDPYPSIGSTVAYFQSGLSWNERNKATGIVIRPPSDWQYFGKDKGIYVNQQGEEVFVRAKNILKVSPPI